jgi:hypothetical protein
MPHDQTDMERRRDRRGRQGEGGGLFRLTFDNPALALDRVQGEPTYLILAVTPDNLIRMKPQNLVTGLPVKHLEAIG